jgi:hypothetical protein
MTTEIIPTSGLPGAEARLLRWMMLCAGAVVTVMLVRGLVSSAVGFALGAALAILSYCWLHDSVSALMSAAHARIPKTLIFKLLVRYPLAFGAVYVFYRTGWLPFTAVLAGLFVPVAGALIEAVIQVRDGFRSP